MQHLQGPPLSASLEPRDMLCMAAGLREINNNNHL